MVNWKPVLLPQVQTKMFAAANRDGNTFCRHTSTHGITNLGRKNSNEIESGKLLDTYVIRSCVATSVLNSSSSKRTSKL